MRKQDAFDFGGVQGVVRNPSCTMCKLHKTANTVCLLGNGPKRADVMIVGEAPGRKEDETGKPFVGQSGKLLDDLLDGAGITREDVYVANAVSCRPPDNRTPSKAEIKSCKKWLDAQIDSVRPKFVLLLGNVPLQSITGKPGIKAKRGHPFEQDGIIYMPTFHPAFALRDPTQLEWIEKDLRLFSEIVRTGGIPREKNINSVLVDTWKKVHRMVQDLRGTVSFDIETTCLYPWQRYNEKGELHPAAVTMFGFGTVKTQWSVPTNNIAGSPWTKKDIEAILDMVEDAFLDCFIVTHNGKFDFLWMWVHYDRQWYKHHDFDTMLAHSMLDENSRHNLKTNPKAGPGLAQRFCGAPQWDIDHDTKTGQTTDLPKLAMYHAHDLYYTRALRFVFGKLLKKEPDVERVFYELMMPSCRLFTEVEYDGNCVDETKFDVAETYIVEQYDTALKKLEEWKPFDDFNWGSSQQLVQFFFGKKKDGGLEIPVLDKTKKGKPSVNESVLKRLDHPCVGDLLKFKEAKQQRSFFIEGWKPFIHRNGGAVYIHPSFKLNGTVTGRPSCEHPNLQQVPRDERVRSLITAPAGWVLIDADLSQIELRIAAELANERELLRTFKQKGDPHWLTALREMARGGAEPELVKETALKFLRRTEPRAKLPKYGDAIELLLKIGADVCVEIDKRWKELRKKAKAVNFGYLYGMWWKKFKMYARDNYGVTVTDEEAQASRIFFFTHYKDFPKWHTRQKRYARLNGYVKTMTGRKRRLPDAMRPQDDGFRQAAERQAINSPVQGFAAELNLMVALQLRKEFGRNKLRIVGTVHDAILMWARPEWAERIIKRYHEIVACPDLFETFEIEIDVPLEGDAKLGAWGTGVSLDKWLKKLKEEMNDKGKPLKSKNVPKMSLRVPQQVRVKAA